ncbi:MAG: hypothetical protein ABIZ56_01105, partial [Chthoniobacteraceae bacterium]
LLRDGSMDEEQEEKRCKKSERHATFRILANFSAISRNPFSETTDYPARRSATKNVVISTEAKAKAGGAKWRNLSLFSVGRKWCGWVHAPTTFARAKKD